MVILVAMERPQTAPRAAAFYGMFFLSGAGALVFENVWFSQTGLIVGNSVWAAALVAGAFMAGLPLRNAAAIPLARPAREPGRADAGLQAAAALSGAAPVARVPPPPPPFGPLLRPVLPQPPG